MDWEGIHQKICQQLIPLRVPQKFLGSEEERQKKENNMKALQKSLLELCRTEALKHLHEDQFELAVPAALRALHFSIGLYGDADIEVVPNYLLLGEASIGMDKLKMAEEYLSLAKYAVLKTPDASLSLRSQLHRNFGRLYMHQGKVKEALEQAAFDIYYSSLKFGPEHICTCGGYYELAGGFMKQGATDKAFSVWEKVVEIWYQKLVAVQASKPYHLNDQKGKIDEALIAEGQHMLSKIAAAREEMLGNVSSTAESYYTLGLLYNYVGMSQKCNSAMEKGWRILNTVFGDDHSMTQLVAKTIHTLNEANNYDS